MTALNRVKKIMNIADDSELPGTLFNDLHSFGMQQKEQNAINAVNEMCSMNCQSTKVLSKAVLLTTPSFRIATQSLALHHACTLNDGT